MNEFREPEGRRPSGHLSRSSGRRGGGVTCSSGRRAGGGGFTCSSGPGRLPGRDPERRSFCLDSRRPRYTSDDSDQNFTGTLWRPTADGNQRPCASCDRSASFTRAGIACQRSWALTVEPSQALSRPTPLSDPSMAEQYPSRFFCQFVHFDQPNCRPQNFFRPKNFMPSPFA